TAPTLEDLRRPRVKTTCTHGCSALHLPQRPPRNSPRRLTRVPVVLVWCDSDLLYIYRGCLSIETLIRGQRKRPLRGCPTKAPAAFMSQRQVGPTPPRSSLVRSTLRPHSLA